MTEYFYKIYKITMNDKGQIILKPYDIVTSYVKCDTFQILTSYCSINGYNQEYYYCEYSHKS